MGAIEHLRRSGYPEAELLLPAKVAEWWGWYTATGSWYSSEETGTDGRTYRVQRISMKPARMVCQEWVSLLLNERTRVSSDDAAVNEWLGASPDVRRFLARAQDLIEVALALGSGAWALRVAGMLENRAVSPDARIIAQRFDARSIVPLTYDEESCTECAFISETTWRGVRYEQLQAHLLDDDGTYRVETTLFDSEGAVVEVPGIGGALPSGIAVPLFSIARPGLTNSYDPFSPFGVSVFDDATGPVQVTDESIDNMHRDMWLGQKMVFLDERMLEKDVYGNVVVPRERDQQLFRKTEADSGNKLIEEYNPDLRVEDNRLALKTGLELLGARSGLGADYFSLDSEGGIKTATEVVADDSDLFRNLRKHQNAIAPAILAVVAGVYALARTVKGESLPESPGVLTVDFDDSVIEDTNAQRDRDRKDVAADLMQPWEYRVRWYGEDEATARAMAGGEGLPPEE